MSEVRTVGGRLGLWERGGGEVRRGRGRWRRGQERSEEARSEYSNPNFNSFDLILFFEILETSKQADIFT